MIFADNPVESANLRDRIPMIAYLDQYAKLGIPINISGIS